MLAMNDGPVAAGLHCREADFRARRNRFPDSDFELVR